MKLIEFDQAQINPNNGRVEQTYKASYMLNTIAGVQPFIWQSRLNPDISILVFLGTNGAGPAVKGSVETLTQYINEQCL